MNQFEDELRQALRRKQPPAGFVQKVLAKTRGPGKLRHWLAIGLAASLAFIGAFELYRYEQGMHAKQQLMLALEITSNKLNAAQHKVDAVNHRSILE